MILPRSTQAGTFQKYVGVYIRRIIADFWRSSSCFLHQRQNKVRNETAWHKCCESGRKVMQNICGHQTRVSPAKVIILISHTLHWSYCQLTKNKIDSLMSNCTYKFAFVPYFSIQSISNTHTPTLHISVHTMPTSIGDVWCKHSYTG